MSKVVAVEGGSPLGMRTGDPYYPLANILPYQRPDYFPDPEITRRTIIATTYDVTPAILQGREKWVLTQGPNAGFLNRIDPPVDPNDPDDAVYAHQLLNDEKIAVIHTPEDMVAQHMEMLPLPPELQDPGQPVRRYRFYGFDAAMFWYSKSEDKDPQDFEVPLELVGKLLPTLQPLKSEEKAPFVIAPKK